MSNLYEILEVSEKASKEVIEKVYRVLAKKYHPDLQKDGNKENVEEKMKQINEAYEILSDDEKRKQYDLELLEKRKEEKIRQEEKIREEIEVENSKQNESYNTYNVPNIEENQNNERLYQDQFENEINIKKQEYDENMRKMQNEMDKAYAQAYNDYLRSLRL